MACDTAFRIIARRHLDAVLAQHGGTCRGDPEALHQIRIALTHLRTAIRFFSPMVDDALRPEIWAELKWLNSQLGMVRDLDVAIDRVIAESGGELDVIAELQHWDEKRAESHRLLARALQSARYRRLVGQTSNWIESGPWSTRRSKEAIRLRRCSLAGHATAQLTEWETTLLKKARKLRKAQRSLGHLNDDARGQTLAASLNEAVPEAGIRFLNRKREKKLLRTASKAYRRLDEAKLFRSSDLAPNAEPAD